MKPQGKGGNPLGALPVNLLLAKFAIPSIIAMLVGSLYNIVDQYFIGNSVGYLGNAATNVAFPLTPSCIAIALLFGIGGASAFNLAMGAGDKETAEHYMGNALFSLVAGGLLLLIFVQLNITKLIYFFGATPNVAPYAISYISITSLGFPFLILTSGGCHLVRADGSPAFSMFCNLVGAIVNTILDYTFVFVLNWGIQGAALATIIGQIVSALMVIIYLAKFSRTVNLHIRHMIPKGHYIGRVASLGTAPCSNQLAMMVVQIALNNSLTYYGGQSVYGNDIPLACVGVISKVNMIFMSFVIGISQGSQPLISFNYGAKNFDRVKQTYRSALMVAGTIAVIAFIMFQVFPRNITSVFGDGSPEYYGFAIRYFRIFLFFTFLNFIQPLTSNAFTAIGKPVQGMFLSLTRQTIFLLPLILVLPLFMGIDGILFAGPIADFSAAVVSFVMIRIEFQKEQYR
ncbi:MAG: MATE family efflux transporter [Lachnospiraceae bacterium]|nr:MATE family efflux transporter [Lachnospiraceae bacterium]